MYGYHQLKPKTKHNIRQRTFGMLLQIFMSGFDQDKERRRQKKYDEK